MLSNHDYGVLRCEDIDRAEFLQGQISSDIRLIQGQTGGMACDINLKGRVMSAFYLYAHDQGYHLIMPLDQIAYALADFKKYSIFSKVQLKDISNECRISPQLSTEPQAQFQRYALLPDPLGQRFMLTDRASFVISKDSATTCSAGDWYEHLIGQNIPTITTQERELFLPHYIGLLALGAVSFDKGCYKGQEVVARMQYRANIKKQVAHCVLSGEQLLKAGDTIEQGEVVNAVVNQGQTYVLCIA